MQNQTIWIRKAYLLEDYDPLKSIILNHVLRRNAADEGDEEEDHDPLWDEFIQTVYSSGKKKVPNTNPKTRDRYPEVAMITLYKNSQGFRKKVHQEYETWLEKKKEEEAAKGDPKKKDDKGKGKSKKKDVTVGKFTFSAELLDTDAKPDPEGTRKTWRSHYEYDMSPYVKKELEAQGDVERSLREGAQQICNAFYDSLDDKERRSVYYVADDTIGFAIDDTPQASSMDHETTQALFEKSQAFQAQWFKKHGITHLTLYNAIRNDPSLDPDDPANLQSHMWSIHPGGVELTQGSTPVKMKIPVEDILASPLTNPFLAGSEAKKLERVGSAPGLNQYLVSAKKRKSTSISEPSAEEQEAIKKKKAEVKKALQTKLKPGTGTPEWDAFESYLSSPVIEKELEEQGETEKALRLGAAHVGDAFCETLTEDEQEDLVKIVDKFHRGSTNSIRNLYNTVVDAEITSLKKSQLALLAKCRAFQTQWFKKNGITHITLYAPVDIENGKTVSNSANWSIHPGGLPEGYMVKRKVPVEHIIMSPISNVFLGGRESGDVPWVGSMPGLNQYVVLNEDINGATDFQVVKNVKANGKKEEPEDEYDDPEDFDPDDYEFPSDLVRSSLQTEHKAEYSSWEPTFEAGGWDYKKILAEQTPHNEKTHEYHLREGAHNVGNAFYETLDEDEREDLQAATNHLWEVMDNEDPPTSYEDLVSGLTKKQRQILDQCRAFQAQWFKSHGISELNLYSSWELSHNPKKDQGILTISPEGTMTNPDSIDRHTVPVENILLSPLNNPFLAGSEAKSLATKEATGLNNYLVIPSGVEDEDYDDEDDDEDYD